MKTLYAGLIGIVAALMLIPLAAAGERVSPSRDNQLNNNERFKVLGDFAGAAVLDKKTGLVWERSPETKQQNWVNAQSSCNVKTVGGRKGWRLPTLQELMSLVDPTQYNPALPSGHPFTFGRLRSFTGWSATPNAIVTDVAQIVEFSAGQQGGSLKTTTHQAWCVRGGQGVDPQ
jgi:hypothetical protein